MNIGQNNPSSVDANSSLTHGVTAAGKESHGKLGVIPKGSLNSSKDRNNSNQQEGEILID